MKPILAFRTVTVSLLFITCYYTSFAQTNISGVINNYTAVTGVNTNCADACNSTCNSSITVASAATFSAGDKFLIIQMKGAKVDTTNTVAHGSFINLYDAGNYEFGYVESISGNIIYPSSPLKETYFTNVTSTSDTAAVQLIRVPVYSGNVNVNGTLTPELWNGTIGGVLAFEATGTVTLNANISADGMGFRGARRAQFAISCGNDTAFYYQSTIWNHSSCKSCGYEYDDAVVRHASEACNSPSCFSNNMSNQDERLGGYRGEGVAANYFKKTFANSNIAYFEKGKGKWGNGGGGGGNHNAGGGGGGNYGPGGIGGNAYNNESNSGCPAGTLGNRRGRGGANLTPTSSKIFMGGGGGEGHDNGGNGSTGTAGGGIIFIEANQVTNNGSYTISANGADVTFVAFGDGSGGGGAGGSIILNLPSGFSNAVTVSARGGKGGDHNNNNCHGTGGGGGGGVVWVAGPTTNLTTNVTGGANGIQVAPSIDCADINFGATSGSAGAFITESSDPTFFNQNTCFLLPVKMSEFNLTNREKNILLEWTTTVEINNNGFQVERSTDGTDFQKIGFINSKSVNSTAGNEYYFVDENISPISGIVYYRLKQMDFDGKYQYYGPLFTSIKAREIRPINISPNPSFENQILSLQYFSDDNSPATIEIYSTFGQLVIQKELNTEVGENNFELEGQDLKAGTYVARFIQYENIQSKIIIINK